MKFILIALTSLTFLSCENMSSKEAKAPQVAASDSANFTSVQWNDSLQNIGILDNGDVAQIKFHFKNTGEKPLLIVSAEPGCGCTVADYPKEPIAKGETGEIVAAFDTKKGNVGQFKKRITVKTNTNQGTSVLFFEGEIRSKDGKGEIPEPVEVPKENS